MKQYPARCAGGQATATAISMRQRHSTSSRPREPHVLLSGGQGVSSVVGGLGGGGRLEDKGNYFIDPRSCDHQ
ncbi:hypothetical protein E2C01_020182 [Portunus trituberculatus]|uniref:Uncharacterized protein n=1 Tax=Portunus trituberculatus TaxID=210409 RepID=A0A5B7DZH2_PORTR|nr:hypothetical protein [Portunus trituberculatus]